MRADDIEFGGRDPTHLKIVTNRRTESVMNQSSANNSLHSPIPSPTSVKFRAAAVTNDYKEERNQSLGKNEEQDFLECFRASMGITAANWRKKQVMQEN